MRVVSLVPSVTETLTDWGVPPIACTRFCERPDLPHVGGTKDPDLSAIAALAPDLVVFCEEENVLAHYDALVGRGLRCHALQIDSVADVSPQLRALAEVAEVPWVDSPSPDVAFDLEVPPVRLRAFVPIWRRPLMTMSGGCYGSSLLELCGVENVFANSETRYPEVAEESVRDRAPDVVLAPTEPYPFAERHLAELSRLAPARLVDGQDLFWWGTRTPAALARLRSVFTSPL